MTSVLEDVGFVKISSFVFFALVLLLYFGKQVTDEYQKLLLFNYGQFRSNITVYQSQSPLVANSLDFSKPGSRTEVSSAEPVANVPKDNAAISKMSPTSPPLFERFGIVDENGIMSGMFRVGDFSDGIMGNVSSGSGDGYDTFDDGWSGIAVNRFMQCPVNMTDYVPCFDSVYERHCPEKGKGLNCLIPQPNDYKRHIPWPKSRDEIWYTNVRHTQLVQSKEISNGISIAKDKIQFLGGDINFINGPDVYIDHISKMVPDIAFGQHTRLVLDVGCGVASFGAYLMSRNVLTISVTPKDVHDNQAQLALERGVPAMVASLATRRLLFPSQAFDLIHCSGRGVDWTSDGGVLLLELNRMLRAGRYIVYEHEENSEEQWNVMTDLATRLCWELVKKEGEIVIWQKPQDNICYLSRQEGTKPPLCDPDEDPDNVWYIDMKRCISRLPENGYGANVSTWPTRLNIPPDRLQTINMDAYISRKELYKAESRYEDENVGNYAKHMHWERIGFRNVLDMKAGFGGFAAAFINQKIDSWVMNVVPVSGPNTLPVIFDRGLIGVMHDWCEPFDTYPRTYDLLHASGLFSVERSRCNIASIMLEMDRILRPGGYAYIHDSVTIIYRLQELGNAMGWHMLLQDTAEGSEASYKLLVCEKQLNKEKSSLDRAKHRNRRKRSHKRDHH